MKGKHKVELFLLFDTLVLRTCKCSVTELYPLPLFLFSYSFNSFIQLSQLIFTYLFFLFYFFETRSLCSPGVLGQIIFLPQPPWCWDYSCEPLCLAIYLFTYLFIWREEGKQHLYLRHLNIKDKIPVERENVPKPPLDVTAARLQLWK
jgi:hypothetical protein